MNSKSVDIRQNLLVDRLAELGPGTPNMAVKPLLAGLTPEDVVPGHTNPAMARACLSALWLLHDFLDESHTISQEIDTPTGSYWHGIMHRREPDAFNSKYWFRQAGNHPVLAQLREKAPTVGYQFTDPFAFIDFVERVRDTGNPDEETAKRVQFLEWRLLFDWCQREAAK
ncbi:hypothetical protein [Zavarzinella formosa]|uniref:hypothetical protein n=1 Tax=Zavarzinella formosa TaxID=360055 RepID=UPI000306E180|nr:hypothetical protein [Zavarzinella formosa]